MAIQILKIDNQALCHTKIGEPEPTPDGWIYHTARMHDPVLMHFATPDPLYAKYQDFSPWSHCAANPLNIIDPDGCLLRNEDGSIFYVRIGTMKIRSANDDNSIVSADSEIGLVFTNSLLPVLVNKNTDMSQPGFNYNCLGYTLLDGQYWVFDQKGTDNLLTEYRRVSTSEVAPDDIVTYDVANTPDLAIYNGEGRFFTYHSVKIKSITKNGSIIYKQKYKHMYDLTEGRLEEDLSTDGSVAFHFWRKNTTDDIVSSELMDLINHIITDTKKSIKESNINCTLD